MHASCTYINIVYENIKLLQDITNYNQAFWVCRIVDYSEENTNFMRGHTVLAGSLSVLALIVMCRSQTSETKVYYSQGQIPNVSTLANLKFTVTCTPELMLSTFWLTLL